MAMHREPILSLTHRHLGMHTQTRVPVALCGPKIASDIRTLQ